MRQNPFLRGTIAFALAIAGFATVGAAPANAGSARAATVVSVPLTIEPGAYTDIEACIGESVTVTGGTYRLVFTDRGNQFLFHANTVNGTAVGDTSGTTYRMIGHQQEVVNEQPTAAFVHVFELRLRVVGEGAAPSFGAHAFMRVVIAPDGTIVVERGDWVITC